MEIPGNTRKNMEFHGFSWNFMEIPDIENPRPVMKC